MSKLQLDHVEKIIASTAIIRDIDLQVDEGEFIVLLGSSGCGKTTLLRMVAGLESVSSGKILIDGQLVNDLPPRVRDVAMVFQNYSLYLHKSVRENLAFGLKMRKAPQQQIKQRVDEVADLLQIRSLLDRKPGQLSGGEKQRVAIGRALARNPKLFLFDEPLSNLDAALRLELRTEIKRIHQQFRTTSLYVTHDQAEAMSMADRLVVINQGQVMQTGEPETVYQNPQNLFVARFLGNPGMNLMPARLEVKQDKPQLRCGDITVPLEKLGYLSTDQIHCESSDKLMLGIRPESITLENRADDSFFLPARVLVVERLGSETQLVLTNDNGEFRVRQQDRTDLKPGDHATVYVRPKDLRLFDALSNQVLNPLFN